MAQPYIGEIRMFAGNFAPAGWMFCEGQLVPISENDALFVLIGTTYGGDGEETFGLPDLQGRIPLHMVDTTRLGEKAGVESVTLTTQQMPVHTHPFTAVTAVGTSPNVQDNLISATGNIALYRQTTASTPMSPLAIGPAGGSQPHENLQPFLCVDFIISLFGIFPSPT
jgi:microcystin-dependent protein